LEEEVFLTDDFLGQLISVGDVDLMIGIPSYNDSKTAAAVLQAVEAGVVRSYRRERVGLVNVDGGSRDGTQGTFLNAGSVGSGDGARTESLRTLRWITTRSGRDGAPGHMLHTMLSAADLLHAKACAVIAASSGNVLPSWVESLLNPIYREGYDFVAPLYTRHKFDGLLTRNLLYPMSKALYGKPMRELRAGEFAFSGRLANYCIAQPQWQQEGAESGSKMWMAINAMCNSFRCCQTYLGPKPRSGQAANVVAAIRQTVGELFRCMETTESYWQGPIEPEPLHTIGPDHQLTEEPVRIERQKLLEMFKSGVNELSAILSTILEPATHAELLQMAGAEAKQFQLSNSLWTRIIYEFAAAYHHSVMNREHLVQALIPVYRGRVYSFITQHRSSGSDALEADLENLCAEFAGQKAYLIERWKAKEVSP
jgi:glucosylglycerate synthase